jgi:CRP-like cAMP-binding protein
MSGVGETLAGHLALIGELPREDRDALIALDAEVREVTRLEDIIRAGDHPTSVVVVLSGFLYRHTLGANGARQIHSFYLPTDAPCLETLYIDYMDNNLGAVVDSRVGLIPHDQIYRLIDERPEVRKLIFRQTLVQGAIFREWLMRNSTMPAHASLAHLFCEMFTRAQAAGLVADEACDLPITQEMLGDAVGLAPVHTNRTLQLLRDTGAMDWRDGRLQVLDWEKLSQTADFDSHYLHLRSG